LFPIKQILRFIVKRNNRMKTLIVDRIEADFAVCEIEEGSFTDIPLKALPNGVKEGDVIKISVEAEETEKRKSNINNLMNNLFKD